VDNGITAHEAVNFANSKKIDVIILDHHQKPASLSGGPKKLPKAKAIIWTDKLCASGIAYFVAKTSVSTMNYELRATNSWLELAAIATITDLLPLTGINRSIVKYGLESLNQTSRVGLKALFEAAGIEKITPYEIGYMIGPRLNASGRIDSALTALRLLCTHNKEKAREYVQILNQLNKERQEMTEEMTIHAKQKVESRKQKEKIIIIDHESYHQGVIGLVAGKLVDQFYLPAIVIAKGQEVSKASARSIFGFNIIEAIRSCESLLINAGGHPMAAGFSLKTGMISDFKHQINQIASDQISEEMLKKTLKIDCELDLATTDLSALYFQLSALQPYGMGNPEPVFASSGIIQNLRTVGAEGKHLKLAIDDFDAIFFNGGHFLPQLKIGQKIKLAYSLALDTFNGNNKLQLKVRDLQL
jgi:single-stranded-DNA-specific exonuclease